MQIYITLLNKFVFNLFDLRYTDDVIFLQQSIAFDFLYFLYLLFTYMLTWINGVYNTTCQSSNSVMFVYENAPYKNVILRNIQTLIKPYYTAMLCVCCKCAEARTHTHANFQQQRQSTQPQNTHKSFESFTFNFPIQPISNSLLKLCEKNHLCFWIRIHNSCYREASSNVTLSLSLAPSLRQWNLSRICKTFAGFMSKSTRSTVKS